MYASNQMYGARRARVGDNVILRTVDPSEVDDGTIVSITTGPKGETMKIHITRSGGELGALVFHATSTVEDIERMPAGSWTWPIDVSNLPAPSVRGAEQASSQAADEQAMKIEELRAKLKELHIKHRGLEEQLREARGAMATAAAILGYPGEALVDASEKAARKLDAMAGLEHRLSEAESALAELRNEHAITLTGQEKQAIVVALRGFEASCRALGVTPSSDCLTGTQKLRDAKTIICCECAEHEG